MGRRTSLAAACVALAAAAAASDARQSAAAPAQARVPQDVRAVSYFPARGGWTLMWTSFDRGAIDRDFGRIASLRANTVRVIVPPSAFGYPDPEPAMAARLEQVLALAARHGLRVQLTLFDWWHAYDDVAGARRWAAALLAPHAGDARIAFLEVKNELRPQDDGAAAWAAALIPFLRETARKPVTVSVPALDPARDLRLLRAALGAAQPDFYSAHFYWRPEVAWADLRAARDAVAPVPLRVGETGYSTVPSYRVVEELPPTRSAREAQQAYYLRSLALTARRLGLPPIAPWILSDFAAGAIPEDDAAVHGNEREYHFGLYRLSGQAKPAAAALRTIFAGRHSYAFNNGFEAAVNGERGSVLPALWRVRAAPGATFARDARVARTGRASARISGDARGTGPDAAFTLPPPDPAVRPGDVSSASAWARATGDCGEVRVRLLWLDRNGVPLAVRRSPRASCGSRTWQRLAVSGAAPRGAVHVQIDLHAAETRGSAWFDDVAYACRRGRGSC